MTRVVPLGQMSSLYLDKSWTVEQDVLLFIRSPPDDQESSVVLGPWSGSYHSMVHSMTAFSENSYLRASARLINIVITLICNVKFLLFIPFS